MPTIASISRELYEETPGPNKCVSRTQTYADKGLRRVEYRSVTSESDFTNEDYVRISEDNGRTWSEWEDVHAAGHRTRDGMEMLWSVPTAGLYSPAHDHYVAMNMQRLFLEEHDEAYRKFWREARRTFIDHSFVWVSRDLADWRSQLVKYEEGPDFSDDDWASARYIDTNPAYAGSNMEVLDNGDILFPVTANVLACCRVLGLDVNEVFPSCPQIMSGLIVLRGRWNESQRVFAFEPSRPVVISDLKSSRGSDEALVLTLESGRIIAVFRGSNVISEGWNTRIQKGTPAHKWYTFSDDHGKTFSDPVPWHFDNGEVFYSPATISRFLRSTRTGKAYWFGNITGPEAYGNAPRYPLAMAEVDEETGFLKRDTHTVIDDRDPEVESERLQLSNFGLLEDRETQRIELYLTKLGADPDDLWRSSAYRYAIEL